MRVDLGLWSIQESCESLGVDKADLELLIILSLSHKCWDYKTVPYGLTNFLIFVLSIVV